MSHLRSVPTAPPSPHLLGQDWLDQVFRGQAVKRGGVIKRNVWDVEREVGRDALELEVRRRGFHLVRTQTHYLIICNQGPIDLIC